MNSLLSTLCSTLTLLFLLQMSLPVNADTRHAKQLDDIMQRGVLRVAMFAQDTPPFYYEYQGDQSPLNRPGLEDFLYTPDNRILTEDSAVVAGLDAELIKGFALKLGVKVKFIRRAESLNDVVKMIANNQADVGICKLSITFDRTTQVLFTKPYIKLRKTLLVNRVMLEEIRQEGSKQEAIQNLVDGIGVIRDSAYVTYAHQRFRKQHSASPPGLAVLPGIVEYNRWQDAVDAVVARKIVAAFRDEAEIKFLLKTNKKYAKDVLTVVLENDYDPKGIALPSDAFFLKFMLETYLDSLGLELTANRVVLDFQGVMEDIQRYRDHYSEPPTRSAP